MGTIQATTSSSGHDTNKQTQPFLALALASVVMAVWVVQSASTSGGQRCAAPREVGGTNYVTVSNRVKSIPLLNMYLSLSFMQHKRVYCGYYV